MDTYHVTLDIVYVFIGTSSKYIHFFTHLQWRPTLNSVLILICEAVGLACALIFARSVRIQPNRGYYVHIRALENVYYVVYHKGVFRKVC